uniref:DC1 domain-containing protein n=2 Tax=Quercus lobata TaxID=97700 RepID=A0A7N2MUR1_QUELO
MELQHWWHWKHLLVFNEDERSGRPCNGCFEPVFGPSYSCKECRGRYIHHKSCAELPLGLHHPSHPNHPLILFGINTYLQNKEEFDKFSKCDVCGEKSSEYSYCCYRCNFNIHIKCSSLSLTIQTEVHDHQLTRSIWKLMKFTCDFCGKEGNLPYCCVQCDFGIHSRCAACPRILKVYRHNHLLHLTPSLQVHQFDSPICLLCVQKVDTLWLYYCSRCDFVAHLYCSMLSWNWEHINLQELEEEQTTESKSEDSELHQSFDSEICKVKKTTVGEDGTEIATKIKHFSHEHNLKLTDEIPNNTKCNGCVQSILSPFYSCAPCSFFLHKSCSKLPKIKRHPIHTHPLTLNYQQDSFFCVTCAQCCNGLKYNCQICEYNYNVQCILLSDTLTHACHMHRLYLSSTSIRQKCSSCSSEMYKVFRCATCDFVLDFKCATLPLTTWYNQHEHPFTLYYTPEDDFGEYYCDICEEERDPKQWFYYCAECSFPAHHDCILGKIQMSSNTYNDHQLGGATQ